MRYLVTGAAGFIGSNLAIELEKQGHEVIAIDNLRTGTKDNLKDFKGDFRNIDVSYPFEIKEDLDAIFHQAAITDPREPDDKETLRVNIDGFKLIINLAKEKNAKLVYASSASLYGNGKSPQHEDQEKDLLSAYAKSKLKMDEMAKKEIDMHIVGLRYFNVFGPNEGHKGRPASMIYHLTKQIKSGQNPKLFKYGEQKRDHIYVKDIVLANIKALDAPSDVYNVGTGRATSFNEIVEYINEALNANNKIEYIDNPYKGTYQEDTQADITRAKEKLKFECKYSAREGVLEYSPNID